MKKTNIAISYDEEKLSAMRMYLGQKNMQVETELEKFLETLYGKNVPANVREFLEMRTGVKEITAEKKKRSKPDCAAGMPQERSDGN